MTHSAEAVNTCTIHEMRLFSQPLGVGGFGFQLKLCCHQLQQRAVAILCCTYVSGSGSHQCLQVGFLADQRRMNVAVTRARRQCTLVCDTETLGHDSFLKGLTEYFEAHGVYSSAAEWEDL